MIRALNDSLVHDEYPPTTDVLLRHSKACRIPFARGSSLGYLPEAGAD
jgi:hypothetical protein